MRIKTIVVSTVLFVSVFMMLISYGNQKVEWKGKIEKEKGITVIKNPREPLFGEIKFELDEDLSIGNQQDKNYSFYIVRDIQVGKNGGIYISDSGNYRVQCFDKNGNYVLTIGRKGQGPGEFSRPLELQIDQETENIYVNDDSRKIKIFDRKGNYINKDIIIGGVLSDFYLDSDRNIWGKFFLPGFHSIKKVNHEGKVVQKLAESPFIFTKKIFSKETVGNRGYAEGAFIRHGYEHDSYISKVDNQTFIYSNSKEYELNIFDKEGNILVKIKKDEPYKKFTKEEKSRIEHKEKVGLISKGYPYRGISFRFPKHMPFFYSIFTDCRGRIYVRRSPRERGGTREKVYDIFSKEGYYIYRATIPSSSYIIRNGYLYTHIVNEDTGEELVRRYRIKNWDEMKDGI
jgi:hypothetical protein